MERSSESIFSFITVNAEHKVSIRVDVNAILIHIVFCINNIHVVPPLKQSKI